MVAVIGDLSAYQARDPAAPLARATSGPSLVVLATPDASTAETVAVQVPQIANIDPAGVVVQLGCTDVLDGFDESYVHARVVEICDELQNVARDAVVTVVGMPPLPSAASSRSVRVWLQCNAAAAITATLRDFAWEPFDHS